jgi:hypothetical protein
VAVPHTIDMGHISERSKNWHNGDRIKKICGMIQNDVVRAKDRKGKADTVRKMKLKLNTEILNRPKD